MNKKMLLSMVGMMVFGIVVGAGIMLNDQAYRSVRGVIEGGGTSNMIGWVNLNQMDLQSMDIETALMMVQRQRTSLLDAQLKSQIESVQDRNSQISSLNELLNASYMSLTTPVNGSYRLEDHINKNLLEKGVISSIKNSYSMAEINSIITSLRVKIDSMNNSQQMDMLRLQSMSNKRNEAFDVMTNFIKKMQDSRSFIIGNMR
jgi:hypothetical protein